MSAAAIHVWKTVRSARAIGNPSTREAAMVGSSRQGQPAQHNRFQATQCKTVRDATLWRRTDIGWHLLPLRPR